MRSNPDFVSEFLCTFAPSTPPALVELATEYHRRTEAYDRQVCTGEVKIDGIMPANGRELYLINRNAKLVRRALVARAATCGYSANELDVTIRDRNIARGAAK